MLEGEDLQLISTLMASLSTGGTPLLASHSYVPASSDVTSVRGYSLLSSDIAAINTQYCGIVIEPGLMVYKSIKLSILMEMKVTKNVLFTFFFSVFSIFVPIYGRRWVSTCSTAQGNVLTLVQGHCRICTFILLNLWWIYQNK